METFLNISVIWFLIGFAFFILEFVIPGFILFFFGIGAWVVGTITLFTDISVAFQIIIFLVSSLVTVLLFRKWVREKLGMRNTSPQLLEDEFIGKTATCSEPIAPGVNGKVTFKGADWDASADEHISPGESVIITATRSIVLIVRSTKAPWTQLP
jgi:membrane protein implicated in regulation of membrane protease activity